MTPKRAAKYRRISSDREGRALGVERQDEDLDALAQRLGFTVVADYVDNDISASSKGKKARPEYQRMLTDAKAGKFDAILAYTTGRLTRRPREFEDLIDLAVDHGIEFKYVKSPDFDLKTAQGREIARNRAARDASEAEELAERVAREKLQAAARGEFRGCRRPYGYGPVTGRDSQGREVRDYNALVPEEADIIRWATEEVLSGASLRSLASELNDRGKVTSTGARWTAHALRRVLRRGRNAGLVEATGEDGQLEVIAPARWPAVISEEQWRAVVAILDDPDRRTNRTNVARRWLGSGLYLCGVCGGRVKSTRATVRSGPGQVAYRCHKTELAEKPHVSRQADFTDQVVEAEVLAYLARPDVAAALSRREAPDVEGLRDEAAALRGQLDEVARQYARRKIDARQLGIISRTVREDLDRVEALLAASVSTSPVGNLLSAEDLAAAWSRLDIPRRQAVVEAVATVRLMPGRRGRPAGWTPGSPYFDPETVAIEWKAGTGAPTAGEGRQQ